MLSVDKQIEVLQRKAEREKKARQLAEEQLEEYSRKIYQANVCLAASLQDAESRHQELEFLNEIAKQIVIDNSLEALFKCVLPLVSTFVDAKLGLVFPLDKNVLAAHHIEAWYQPDEIDGLVPNSDAVIKVLNKEAISIKNHWHQHAGDKTHKDSLLNITLNIDTKTEYLLYFTLKSTGLNTGSLNALNTATDLLTSGLRRREYAAKIIKRNLQLQESITNVEKIQTQLIHSEKMASLGQLAAGVAHEINNPIGFINANSDMLNGYTSDVEKCIELLRCECAKQTLDSEAFAKITQQFELDYILTGMHEILEENQDGIRRVMGIVSGLSTFSHPGEQDTSSICISACIQRSLQLVANELKYKHVVDNQLPAILPSIQGNLGQLQQVFVILIINAVQAMSDGGTLTIYHTCDASTLTLSIADTGYGISPENIHKIFTPFFTTKPVGSGTGLGLSITHAILEAHDAVISVDSEVGRGTRFHLTFNIK